MARLLQTRGLLLFLALGAAGCGSITGPALAGSGDVTIRASAASIATNGQVELRAYRSTGEAAPVAWSIVSGTNAATLGQGHIDATGLYTAPGSLSADSITVRVRAAVAGDPKSGASVNLTVHPGFVQPLLPQNVALTPGASAEVTAQIAEVDAGSVKWSLREAPGGAESTNGGLGTVTDLGCRRSSDHYTTCSATYSAPSASLAQPLYVIASVNGSAVTSPLRVLINNQGIVSDPVNHQNLQSDPVLLGTSGGNDGDYDTWEDSKGNSFVADCCGGTLGALVQDSEKNNYILSNNHVLAESDQGHVGDSIDQPGLIDGACTPLNRPGSTLRPIGTLRTFVPLASRQTNVDAALAAVATGAVDPQGRILGLGAPQQGQMIGAAAPMAGRGESLTSANLGMNVAKSGRTTGLTCSSIDAVALTVKVDYYKDCAETQPYTTKTYSNQIGIGGAHFTDSGDSGALVLDASNSEAIGLYFAGGTDGDGHGLSVANPIGDVLNELGAEMGSSLSVVGSENAHPIACLRYDTALPTAPFVGTNALAHAQTVAEQAADTLHGQGLLGTAAGKSFDSAGDAVVIVYVDHATADVPQTVGGLRTQVIVTDPEKIARGDAPTMPILEPGLHLTAAQLADAKAVEARVAPGLMKDPAIFGVGVTQSQDNPAEAALMVLVDMSRNPQKMPPTIGGLRVRYLRLHRFHTTLSKWATGHRASACRVEKAGSSE